MPVIRFRNNTAELAALHNLVLDKGEPGWESDSNVFKIGDGVTPWVDLEPPNGGGGGGSAPNGTLVLVEHTGAAWPNRPSGGTLIRVHWVGGDVDHPPTQGISGHDIWSLPMQVG
jgi:hypothetical protein